MAVPYQDGGKQSGEWNNVRLYIANSRTTILVDKHREQDAHDTLTALVQDSAHEMFARDPGRVESILNVRWRGFFGGWGGGGRVSFNYFAVPFARGPISPHFIFYP